MSKPKEFPFRLAAWWHIFPRTHWVFFLFCFFTPPWMYRQGSDCQAYRAFKTHLLLLLFFNSHCRVSVLIERRISWALLALVTTRLPGRDPHMLGVLGSPYMDVFLCFLFPWTLLKALSSKHAHCTPKKSPFSKHKSNNQHIAKLLLRAFA